MPVICREKTKETEAARLALDLWSGTCREVLVPFGRSASSVFGVRAEGRTHFLRLTDPSFRTPEDVGDELAFLAHLQAHGVLVAMPVASRRGRMVEGAGGQLATLFRRAPGLHVRPDSAHWTKALFLAWGRALAGQHEAARTFRNPSSGWRQDWRREPVLVQGLAAISATDPDLAKAADDLLTEVAASAPALGEVGTVHADMAPQNFRFDRQNGLTAFDFDNCCRHWFLYDLAVSQSVLRGRPERETAVAWLVEGYREIRPLPGERSLIGLLLRLRLLYVYCDRRYSFGPVPGPAQRAILDGLRARLIDGPVW
jgi:Ser/Thr protein kinase RdoA (MazF antagonist)